MKKSEIEVSFKQRLDLLIVHHLLAWLCRLIFKVYGRWKVIGLENVPRTGSLIFAANHASYIDPVLGWAAIYGTRKMWGIARSELWDNKILAYLLEAIQVFPVRRQTADRAMLRKAFTVLEHGYTIGIFPEGTRTYDGLLNPGQPGIGLMVQKIKCPVVPAALIGTFEMLPRNQKRSKRVSLRVIFGKPILFDEKSSREEITTRVMADIASLMTQNGCPMEPPGPERAEKLLAREKQEAADSPHPLPPLPKTGEGEL